MFLKLLDFLDISSLLKRNIFQPYYSRARVSENYIVVNEFKKKCNQSIIIQVLFIRKSFPVHATAYSFIFDHKEETIILWKYL